MVNLLIKRESSARYSWAAFEQPLALEQGGRHMPTLTDIV